MERPYVMNGDQCFSDFVMGVGLHRTGKSNYCRFKVERPPFRDSVGHKKGFISKSTHSLLGIP